MACLQACAVDLGYEAVSSQGAFRSLYLEDWLIRSIDAEPAVELEAVADRDEGTLTLTPRRGAGAAEAALGRLGAALERRLRSV